MLEEFRRTQSDRMWLRDVVPVEGAWSGYLEPLYAMVRDGEVRVRKEEKDDNGNCVNVELSLVEPV